MERLASSEGKGIRAFFSPKSAEDAEKQRKEREKAFAEKKAQRDLQQSELQTIKESWGLQPFELESVVKLGRPSLAHVGCVVWVGFWGGRRKELLRSATNN